MVSGLPELGIVTRHAPRPCVNANNVDVWPTVLTVRASVITFAKPVFSLAQFAPPSTLTNTPRSVPTYRRDELWGSTVTQCAGTSGSPVIPDPSIPTHVAP